MCASESHRASHPLEREDYAGLKEREGHRLIEILGGMGLEPSVRWYEHGDIICRKGDYGDALYVISSGAVRLSVRYDKTKEASLMLLGPHDVFGELVHESATIQATNAEAFTSCEIAKVPKVFVERATRSNSEFASTLLKLTQLELAQRRRLVQRLLPRRTETRLAYVLSDLAESFGVVSGGTTALQLSLSHEDLASMVASSRESVTAAMVRLRERGILSNKNETVYIVKPEELPTHEHGRGLRAKPTRSGNP